MWRGVWGVKIGPKPQFVFSWFKTPLRGTFYKKKNWVDCPFKSLERKSAGHAGEECVNLFIAIDMIPITDQLTAMNIMPFKLCTKIQKYLTIRNSA